MGYVATSETFANRTFAAEPTWTYLWRVSEVVTYPVMRGLAHPSLNAQKLPIKQAIQMHPNCKVIVDEAAAAELQGREYYDFVFSNEPEWARYRNRKTDSSRIAEMEF